MSWYIRVTICRNERIALIEHGSWTFCTFWKPYLTSAHCHTIPLTKSLNRTRLLTNQKNNNTNLLLLLRLPQIRRLTIHEHRTERQEPDHRGADAADPRPRRDDVVRAFELVVGHVPDRNRHLLLDVGQEGPLVVDEKVENAVLVGQGEGGGVGGIVGGGVGRREVEAVEGGEHGELELESIGRRGGVGGPGVPGVLGERDGVGLAVVSLVWCNGELKRRLLTTLFLTL